MVEEAPEVGGVGGIKRNVNSRGLRAARSCLGGNFVRFTCRPHIVPFFLAARFCTFWSIGSVNEKASVIGILYREVSVFGVIHEISHQAFTSAGEVDREKVYFVVIEIRRVVQIVFGRLKVVVHFIGRLERLIARRISGQASLCFYIEVLIGQICLVKFIEGFVIRVIPFFHLFPADRFEYPSIGSAPVGVDNVGTIFFECIIRREIVSA